MLTGKGTYTKSDNVDEIVAGLQKKASKASVLAQLREIKAGTNQTVFEKSPQNGSNPNGDPADAVSDAASEYKTDKYGTKR